MTFNMEEVAMKLVGYAGESRSLAFEALHHAKNKDFHRAKELIEEAKVHSFKAHEIQSELIFEEADGNKVEMGLLLVHAQDHLMTSMLARELIDEIIVLHQLHSDKEER